MCGIVGFLNQRNDALLRRMADRIRHRGPDSDGFFSTDKVSLGMRRLAVIDVEGGRQPLFNETGRVAVVFNGEIYNFQDLRKELSAKGHVFKTRTDTEVIVHLYEEEGPALVRRLNGMFAFALWDEDRQRLLLARDPLGIKPLYYAPTAKGLAFASELKALLCWPGLSREISSQALRQYLGTGSIPAPHSIFKSVKKLSPGHWLTADKEGIRLRSYWSPPPPDESLTFEDSAEEVRRLLEQAVKSQLVSDVPLGVFLSGGLDSSALAVFASRQSARPLKTFSIGYRRPDDEYNELDKARKVAGLFGCDHREFILSPHIQDLLAPLVRCFDEPFADSSAVPSYLIARETRSHVTVALAGVGGDELFAGYPRYLGLTTAHRARNAPAWLKGGAHALAGWLPDRGGSVNWTGRVKRFLEDLRRPLPEQYARWMSFLSPEYLEILLKENAGEALSDGFSHEALPSVIAQGDLVSYLPSDLFCLADRTSMAHSLEVRVPFCDLPLVEFLARVPLSEKLRGRQLKALLKQILAPSLPKKILHQTKKGFSIPLARWIREELRDVLEDCLSEKRVNARGHFHYEAVQRLRREHEEGRQNHADVLWGLIMLEIWHREYVDQPAVVG